MSGTETPGCEHIETETKWQTTFSNALYLIKDILISINISLKLVPKGQIHNISALVNIMAWHRLGDKPLPGPIKFTEAYMRNSASMS